MSSVSREQTQAKLDKLSAATMAHTPRQDYTVADRLEQQAETYHQHAFLLADDTVISYGELNARANRFAHVLRDLGVVRGDVCALMMDNRADFFAILFAFAKLGVTSALLNIHARGEALTHALSAASAKLLFIGDECLSALTSREQAALAVDCYRVEDVEPRQQVLQKTLQSLQLQLTEAPDYNPPRSWRQGLVGEDSLLYVFTSGTTGLPKAARISHMKWLGVGDGMRDMLEYSSGDVFYCVLPLYHGAAGMSLTSSALASGASIVLRRRFSASQFWPEVRRYGVTVCQYIGEVCRYLNNQPASPDDRRHGLRKMMGAGLGADIWQAFQQRFAIAHIFEGWSATEANCSLINIDNKPGSCGRIAYAEKTNLRLVKYDIERGCHVLDEQGKMICCQPGEVGEVVGMILDLPDVGAGRFEGYTDPQATEQKIYRGVFSEGDSWWASGDLMRCDEEGYFYFVDRIGDTYRWKSENVSTQEVSQALADYPGMELINVYGVTVPGQEGRAGMAAIVMQPAETFDPQSFYRLTEQRLPRYAAPLFLRLSDSADLTATFKLRKVDLQRQAYDPKQTTDPLYVRDERRGCYRPLDSVLLQELGIAESAN
ncbi:fatty-acyl-CoA synthase [Sinobacterium caligoides]|uniref:Fatty-acyl-CoA synthase n=1 Tax=Sinobacterium caligoides TaxID=933926 RepID=A0A3N2DQ01_9GAMM|nr:long-chain-acyl-CoA synthetase [Sinobacterium caligoides]ROS01898.1 fatty-acyl-CoA synthase [Sinobacterium caligoides]